MKMTKRLLTGLLAVLLLSAPAWAMQHTIGLGVASVPDYEGSEDYQSVPLLMLKGSYDSGRSFNLTGTRLRVNVIPSKTFSLGPVLNYRLGRDDVDNDRVDAMKDIDDAFEVGVYGSADIDNWLFDVEILADVSDTHDGQVAAASLGYRWNAAPTLTFVPSAFISYADGDYMNTYFGVNSGNRGRSGLPNYSADKGFKDVGFRLTADYTPWEQWGISGILALSALQDEAKDSPIVDKEGDDSQLFIGVMGTYRWGSK